MVAAVATALLAAAAPPARGAAPPAAAAAPAGAVVDDLRFRNAQGGEIRLGDLRGRIVVLYTFTSAAPAARTTLEQLSRLDARADCDLVILALSLDRDPRDLARLLEAARPRIAMLLDGSGELASALGVGAAPVAFVLDRQGAIRGRHALESGDDFGPLEGAVAALLGR